jgi:hypothetical protein
MTEQIIILVERKGRKQFTRFMELFKNRAEIPIKEIRSKIPKSTFYDFILTKIYTLNEAIKNINPNLEAFIIPTLQNNNGKIIQTFKRNSDIEIIDEDPNFFYLRLKSDYKQITEEVSK